MLDLMQNCAFLRPWMLLLLIPAILFAAFFKPNLIGDCSWKKVCEAKFLDYLLIKNDHKKIYWIEEARSYGTGRSQETDIRIATEIILLSDKNNTN